MKTEVPMPHTPASLGISIVAEVDRDSGNIDPVALQNAIVERLQRALTELPSLPARRSEDVVLRETKFLQTSLSPFLTTPLRSDAAEVTRILGESLGRAMHDGDRGTTRSLSLRCGALLDPSDLSADLKPLAQEGLEFLQRIFPRRFTRKSTFLEFTAICEGSFWLKTFTDIVRDATPSGIGASVVREAVGSLLFEIPSSLHGQVPESGVESVVTFSVTNPELQSMLPRIAETIARLSDKDELLTSSVWNLLGSYAGEAQIQVRTLWKGEEKLESGTPRIWEVVGRSSAESTRLMTKSLWCRKVTG
jgi:hypothetical protein